jgi:hypothetical protein
MQILFSYVPHVKGGGAAGPAQSGQTVVVARTDGYNENVICERGFRL